MFKAKAAFSSFSVYDLAKAKSFYNGILGLRTEENAMGALQLHLPDGGSVLLYPKDNHEPATFTVLNLQVENIDNAVDELMRHGVRFEHYEGFPADERGIVRSTSPDQGPTIAWFTDPSGNIIALIEQV